MLSERFSFPPQGFAEDDSLKAWTVSNYGNNVTGSTSALFVTKVASDEVARFALMHVIQGADPTKMHGPADLDSCRNEIERCHDQILAGGWVPLAEHIMH